MRHRNALVLLVFLPLFLFAGPQPQARSADSDLRALRAHDRMMRRLGGDLWEEMATLEFDFVVRSDGQERLRRSHYWDRRSNEYRVTLPTGGPTQGGRCTVWIDLDRRDRGVVRCDGSLVEGERKGELLETAWRVWINDTFWLLMPFKWKDPGVQLTWIGPERQGKTRWDVVLLTFEEGTGVTPGDRYWAYVNRDTGRMDKWEMLLQGREGPAVPVWWKGWETQRGIQFSTRKEMEGSGREILIDELQVSPLRHPERFDPPAPLTPALAQSRPEAGTQTRPHAEAAPATPTRKGAAESDATAGTAAAATIGLSASRGPGGEGMKDRKDGTPAAGASHGTPEDSSAPRAEDGVTASGSSPSGARLLVLNKADNEAVLVDPGSLEVLARAPTDPGPHEVVVSADGRRAYVTNYGHSQPGNTITVLAVGPRSLEVEETWDLGAYRRPHGIVRDARGDLWITAEGAEALVRLDPSDGSVEQVARTGQKVSHMVALAENQGKAFVANIGSGNVTVVPLGEGRIRHVAVGTGEEGSGPEGIAVTPDGRFVWVADRYRDELVVLDAGDERVVHRIPAGDFPIRVAVSPDGATAAVSNVRGGDVWLYDVARRERRRVVDVGTAPIGILIPPGSDRLFVADTRENTVSLYDLESGELQGRVETGRQPDGMAWVPPGASGEEGR